MATDLLNAADFDVPTHIQTLDDFRAWADSDDFPQHGRFAFINGQLWADLEMETLYTHNQIKGEFAVILGAIVRKQMLGLYCHDRMRLVNPEIDTATEPDGMFVSYDALRAGRVTRVYTVAGRDVKEIRGAPDMVLEVVSESSKVKDTVDLFEAYYRAGVLEYWLVDATVTPHEFTIYVPGSTGYVAVAVTADGWQRSGVFGGEFRLVAATDPLGDPLFTLEHRP